MPTLTWIGRDAVVNHHQDVPHHLLREPPELGHGGPMTTQREKRRIGELPMQRSEDSCVFVMPNGKDLPAVTTLAQRTSP